MFHHHHRNASWQNSPRRRQPANASVETVEAWKAAHPEAWAWMLAASRRDNDFACSLNASLSRYGRLTDNQLAAVERCITRDAVRATEDAQRAAAAPVVNGDPIAAAFSNAKSAGIKRPKIKLAEFAFSYAPDHGRNPGAIYVKANDGEDTYLGMVKDGRFIRSRQCAEGTQANVLDVMRDPRSAAIAYGKQFGICCICSRDLTDPVSVAAGIGPVCADRMGWAR